MTNASPCDARDRLWVNESRTVLVRLWANGKARDLGTLGHPWWNVAHDLNDNGAVVGNVQRAPHGPNVPYVWRDGRFTVLPGRPSWTHAAAINDAGVVVGGGYRGREPVAVVWR